MQFDDAPAVLPLDAEIHSISATTDVTQVSRAGFQRLENGYKHFWEENDAISVFPGTTSNTCYTLVEGLNEESALFRGSAVLGDGDYYMVYPYNEKNSLSGSTLTVEYPAVQNYRADKDSYDKNSYLMVANNTKASANFKNITAVVRISLTGSATISKIELRSIGNEVLTGPAEVAFKEGEPVVSLNGEESVVTLNTSVTLTDKAKHFYIAIPPVALSKGFSVTVYDIGGYAMTKRHTFNRKIERNTVIEMPAFAYVATDKVATLPIADMLDVVFLADGTAKDISSRSMAVQTFADRDLLKVPFDYTLGRYIGRFDHATRFVENETGTHSTGYYKIDYANDEEFKNRLADGHSLESLVLMDAEAPSVEQNDKWFSSIQAGGVGFIVGDKSSGWDFRYAVNLTTTGKSNWVIARSGVVPQRGVWYHVVGVWNKEAKTVSIYINGEKKATEIVADGSEFFLHSNSVYHWFGVGVDASKNQGAEGWDGDVAIARVYDKPLSDEDVVALYNASNCVQKSVELVSGISCLSKDVVSDGYNFMIKGTGFVAGDILKLRTHSQIIECETKVYPDGASLTIPSDFTSGIYNVELLRGGSKQVLAEVDFTMSSLPQADMLDIVFKADGTAYDSSSMQADVVTYAGENLTTYPSYDGRYVARFMTAAGYDNYKSSFYSVPYVKTNAFGLKQADGHSLEAIGLISEVENVSCMIATHQSGGTAFRFQVSQNGYTNVIAFSPYVGGEYRYAEGEKSQIELNKFYHLVGSWNKDTGDIVLYVNGEQAGIITGQTGNFKDSSYPYFVIGGDPGKGSGIAQNAWNGSIAMARVYDKALSALDAKALYEEALKSWPNESAIRVSGVRLFSNFEVSEGWKYSIYGNGIEASDVIKLRSTATGVVYDCTTTSVKGKATIVIPEGLPSDTFDVILYRGNSYLKIASTTLIVTPDAMIPPKPKTIAHRGYFYVEGGDNLPHNSIAGLNRSQELEGLHSTEFDVWMTADDVLVVHHDATIGGVKIQSANYSEIENMTLSNGETLPTLELFLTEYAKNPSVKLLVHVKEHANSVRTQECIGAIVTMLREKSILDKAEWLVSTCASAEFIKSQCKSEVPDLMIACADAVDIGYAEALAAGYTLNLQYTTVNSNPAIVKEIHKNGLKMIVWSITSEAAMLKYMALGCDYFNANRPDLLIELSKLTFVEE